MSSDLQLSPPPSKSSTAKAYHSIQEREEYLISPLKISNFDWETSAAVSMPENHANDYNNYGVQHSYMHQQPLPFDSNASGVVQQSLAITGPDHVDAFSQHLLPPAQAPHEAAAVHPSALFNTAGKQPLLPPRPSAPLITSTNTMAPPNASMFSELLQYDAALHQHTEMNEKEQQQQQQQQTFPFKLYEMLEYARASGVSSSISWLSDGTGFVIHNKDAMMNDLTPMFFNQTKFRSFVSVLILTAVAVEVTQCLLLLLLSISTLLDLAALSHH